MQEYGGSKHWSQWVIAGKKRGHQVCRELRAWEELRGGVEGEYVQNTLHEIVKELIKAI